MTHTEKAAQTVCQEGECPEGSQAYEKRKEQQSSLPAAGPCDRHHVGCEETADQGVHVLMWLWSTGRQTRMPTPTSQEDQPHGGPGGENSKLHDGWRSRPCGGGSAGRPAPPLPPPGGCGTDRNWVTRCT